MAKHANTVKVVDHGAVNLLEITKKAHPLVDIGVIGAKAEAKHGDATVGLIASVHEFGLGNCPRRSFIADWFEEATPEMIVFVKRLTLLLVQGKIKDGQFVKLLGEKAKGDIQKRMALGIEPKPLKYRVGTPLIDTGVLRSSITYREVKT